MMGLSAFRMMSDVFARLAVRHWGGGQPTNGRQDKSREVRPGRMGEDSRHINDLARCAPSRDSLHVSQRQAKSMIRTPRSGTPHDPRR
jgi:hypothetical protein